MKGTPKSLTPKHEEFNRRYRPGGGYPKEKRRQVRDSITEMRQASHNPGMLWNAMAAMGCQVVSSEDVYTGCGGL